MASRNNSSSTFDVAVIGAGVFGAWTALKLQHAGLRVALVDAHGAGNSRASSGGESRIMRMGYGADEIYTRSAIESFVDWQEFIAQTGRPLFHRTGVLWLAHQDDQYLIDTKETLARVGVNFEELSRSELEYRYPQIDFTEIEWGLLEPDSGVLMARQLVAAVVQEAVERGAGYLQDSVKPPTNIESSQVRDIETQNGHRISADKFLFACGPWLPKLFPGLLGELIQPTRQEEFFFGVPAGERRFAPPAMPVWIDFHDLIYAIPDLEARGFKIAIDEHGPGFDPETGNRTITAEGTKAIREHLARRLPSFAQAPVIETRVCQYENTSNGDFLIDRHPSFENVWLMGGGSGHGFKHGPAVGEYAAALVTGVNADPEPRFSLATKGSVQRRAVY